MSQAPDGEPIQPEDEEQVALQVSRQRKDKARTSNKASIAKAQPLKVAAKPQAEREGRQQQRTFRQAWRRTAGELSEEEQRRAVEQVRPPEGLP